MIGEKVSLLVQAEYTLMRIMSVTIYDYDQIETFPDTQVHREVNLELIKAERGTLDDSHLP